MIISLHVLANITNSVHNCVLAISIVAMLANSVRLHVRVIRAMQAYNRTQAQWEMLIDRALALEDEVRNIAATHRSGVMRLTQNI